jgi:glycosyltransferase involved in cell wall biosynthesis
MNILLLSILVVVALCWITIISFGDWKRVQGLTYDSQTPPETFDSPANQLPPTATWPLTPPYVTVIVPGRNEGHVLWETLGSICRQDYPNFRVVFVDDQSTDNTEEIARRLAAQFPRLKIIHNTQPPPPGWMGKNWAIHQAGEWADSEYLLFVDSDMHFHPQCLHQAMRLARHRNLDLLSILPRPQGQNLLEQGFLMVALTAMFTMAAPHRSNDSRSRVVLTAGAFLLFRRQAYEAIGGHEAIKGQLIEDLALGGRAKNRGFRVFTVVTRELLFGRMYEGVADTFRGGKKNVYAGLKYNPLAAVALALGFLSVGVLLPIYPVVAACLVLITPTPEAWGNLALAGLVNALALVHMRRVRRFLGGRPGAELTLAAAVTFCLAILMASVWDYYTGGNVWSGRTYNRKNMAHPDEAMR